jgi:hypothetical protein
LRIVNHYTYSVIELYSYDTPETAGREHNVKVTYTGGWATIPGDIQQAAIIQMKVDRQRTDAGMVGINSLSQDGQSVSYDQSGLVKEVRDILEPYRIEV